MKRLNHDQRRAYFACSIKYKERRAELITYNSKHYFKLRVNETIEEYMRGLIVHSSQH